MFQTKYIRLTLLNLVVLDVILAAWGFFFPEFWFSFFHNSTLVDPQALLYRCAANWTAFALIQAWAYKFWQERPYLLAVVAGCRLGDCLTDITCAFMCSKLSMFGAILFPVAGVGNLVIGWYLLKYYRDNGRTITASPA